jgi:hypothetical protein
MQRITTTDVLAAILILTTIMLILRVAQSQVLISLLRGDKVSSEKFHLGLEGRLNLADVTGLEDTKLRTGFYLGSIGEWCFARNW